MLTLAIDRLDLVAATVEILDAELESRESLASALGARVPTDWPPGEYDRPAIEHFRSRLAENPGAAGWYGWYALARRPGGRPDLVGTGGYLGPPNGDGVVEIGYSLAPAFTGRGYATELVRALVAHAFASGVARVIAHARPENSASVAVLERSGLAVVGPGREAGTVQFGVSRREGPD